MAGTWRPRADLWRAPTPRNFALIALGILLFQVTALTAMGHPLICVCGSVELWHGANSGAGTSQHLTDWYTFTHVVHGFLFYLLLRMLVPGAPLTLLVIMALGMEGVWEIVENLPAVIERYRQSALAAGYFGDSVINSISDSIAMLLGFIMARRLPVWGSLTVVAGLEGFLALMIRDNLLLNVIQLLYPLEAISRWQGG